VRQRRARPAEGTALSALNPKNLTLCVAAGVGQDVAAVAVFTAVSASTAAGYAPTADRLRHEPRLRRGS
jgi:hypothetical protein